MLRGGSFIQGAHTRVMGGGQGKYKYSVSQGIHSWVNINFHLSRDHRGCNEDIYLIYFDKLG